MLAFALAALPAAIALGLTTAADPGIVLVAGLLVFGVLFAMNSAVHSYLILAYADGDRVAMNVGFYYMANAGGRLAGTVLSGALYQWRGLEACLWASAVLVLAAGLISALLPGGPRAQPSAENSPVVGGSTRSQKSAPNGVRGGCGGSCGRGPGVQRLGDVGLGLEHLVARAARARPRGRTRAARAGAGC